MLRHPGVLHCLLAFYAAQPCGEVVILGAAKSGRRPGLGPGLTVVRAYMGRMSSSPGPDAPYHAHIYYSADQRAAAETLREAFRRLTVEDADPRILFVGAMRDGKAGPHPVSQYEIHFLSGALSGVLPIIEASGLRALVHPLTDDDLADHTTLAHWIGAPLKLDLTTLDPPGMNQGVPRFGKTDF